MIVQTNAFMKRRRDRGSAGFTLVELMVVVAVIAILAAMAMPQFLSAADKAKGAKEKADIQTITNAAQLYMIDKGNDVIPTIDSLYTEGYLAEKVKTSKGGNYVISYEQKDGSTDKRIVVKSEK